MGFEYEDEELTAKINGTVYKFRAPTAMEQKTVSAIFDKGAPEGGHWVDLYIDYFIGLGLPKDVVSAMTSTGLTKLFSFTLTGEKKS